MKRRYVYLNILVVLIALILPCPFLKFGQYSQGRYTRVSANRSILPQFQHLVPSFNELEKYLKDFSRNYSYLASLYELGKIGESGNQDAFPIYNMVLSTGYAKPIIVFLGGIYSSDISSPLALMKCFTQWTTDAKILGQLLPLYDFHFIPLVNPAGYDFVYQMRKKGQSSSWLKNMRRFKEGKAVNILYNFDIHSVAFPKEESDDYYGGEKPFSEPESMIIRDYILEMKKNIAAVFLIFSSTKNNAISYPHSNDTDRYYAWILQEQLVTKALMDVRNVIHNSMEVISTVEFDGAQGGRMDDWLMETLPKSLILNLQLRFTLKDEDLLKNLNTDVNTLLKALVVNLYQDEYLGHRNYRKKLYRESYYFSWKKVYKYIFKKYIRI